PVRAVCARASGGRALRRLPVAIEAPAGAGRGMSSLVKAAAWREGAALAELNRKLETLSAEQRVAFSLEHLPGAHVLTSSFGAQAAVSLHLVTRQSPRLPGILLDTGYLFPETYAFVEKLTERLSLNLKVYRSTLSPAWIEARFGKLCEHGVAGLATHNH